MTKVPKRLIKFGMQFKGPHNDQLFEALFVAHEWEVEYDKYFIGTGESKAVAMTRALSHMKGSGLAPIFHEIEGEALFQCPINHISAFIEGDGVCQVYCIIGISAIWEDV